MTTDPLLGMRAALDCLFTDVGAWPPHQNCTCQGANRPGGDEFDWDRASITFRRFAGETIEGRCTVLTDTPALPSPQEAPHG